MTQVFQFSSEWGICQKNLERWLVGVWKGLNLGSIRNFSLCFGMYPKIIDVNPKLIPKRGVVQFCHLYVKIRSAMHKLWTKKRFCNISLASFSYSVSPGTVSNRPNLYSVTFWSSYEEVQLYREWIKIRSYKWSSIILSQFWSVETWPLALI